jgi:hypothetical protein
MVIYVLTRCNILYPYQMVMKIKCTSCYGLSRMCRVRGKLQKLLKSCLHKTWQFVRKMLTSSSRALQSVVDLGFQYNPAPFLPVFDGCMPIQCWHCLQESIDCTSLVSVVTIYYWVLGWLCKFTVNVTWYKDCNSQGIVAALKELEVPLLIPVYAYVPVMCVVCQRLYGSSSEEICEFMLLSKYLVLKLVSWRIVVIHCTPRKPPRMMSSSRRWLLHYCLIQVSSR